MSDLDLPEPVESPVHARRGKLLSEDGADAAGGSREDRTVLRPSGAPEDEAQGRRISRGYLMKQTRDGRWQRRWFELNGRFLTYYKSDRMKKLLAVLDLLEVSDVGLVTDAGEIQAFAGPDVAEASLQGMLFIQLNFRKYILRAENRATASGWINAIHEVRSQPAGDERSAEMSGSRAASDALQKRVQDGSVKDVHVARTQSGGGMSCCMGRANAVELRES